jgi:hypothetical protein
MERWEPNKAVTLFYILRASILVISDRKRDYDLRRMYLLLRYVASKLEIPEHILVNVKPEILLTYDIIDEGLHVSEGGQQ